MYSDTKEMNIIPSKPMIKDWELYFMANDGYENRLTVAKAVALFWENTHLDRLEMPGNCMLGGKVYGRQGFGDGDEIFTSNVKSIERVKRGHIASISHDLMCANTKSGSKYYFYSDDYNAYMALLLGDMYHKGELNPMRFYYIKPEFRSLELI